jgi:hypothetical protein
MGILISIYLHNERIRKMHRRCYQVWSGLLGVFVLVGCGSDTINQRAQTVYVEIQDVIYDSMELAFKGFNTATSATVPPQTKTGDNKGTLTVTGQVDQGTSPDKAMKLQLELVDYPSASTTNTTFKTGATKPSLNINLKGIPNGTLDALLSGDFLMSGTLSGTATLSITMTGTLQKDPSNTSKVQPAKYSIKGTTKSDYGTHSVDIQDAWTSE